MPNVRYHSNTYHADNLPPPAVKLVVTQYCRSVRDCDIPFWAWIVVGVFYDAQDNALWSTELFVLGPIGNDDDDDDDESVSSADSTSSSELYQQDAGPSLNGIPRYLPQRLHTLPPAHQPRRHVGPLQSVPLHHSSFQPRHNTSRGSAYINGGSVPSPVNFPLGPPTAPTSRIASIYRHVRQTTTAAQHAQQTWFPQQQRWASRQYAPPPGAWSSQINPDSGHWVRAWHQQPHPHPSNPYTHPPPPGWAP
jgi:hypothetical protein